MSGKPFQPLLSDEEAERFIDEVDLSEYDLSKGHWVTLELRAPAGHERVAFNLEQADVRTALRRATDEGVGLETYLERLVHESLARVAS